MECPPERRAATTQYWGPRDRPFRLHRIPRRADISYTWSTHRERIRTDHPDALVESHRHLCRRAAYRFLRRGLELRDLEQVGRHRTHQGVAPLRGGERDALRGLCADHDARRVDALRARLRARRPPSAPPAGARSQVRKRRRGADPHPRARADPARDRARPWRRAWGTARIGSRAQRRPRRGRCLGRDRPGFAAGTVPCRHGVARRRSPPRRARAPRTRPARTRDRRRRLRPRTHAGRHRAAPVARLAAGPSHPPQRTGTHARRAGGAGRPNAC